MRYRRLGTSDLDIAAVSLGSWKTYGGGGLSDEQAEACIDTAFACGINFIDTANVYSGGASESFLGKVLSKRPRGSYILATKLRFPVGDGSGEGLSAEQARRSARRASAPRTLGSFPTGGRSRLSTRARTQSARSQSAAAT
jgi:aryl-alcohol dehydrogenase-like predicted oxidoreductase